MHIQLQVLKGIPVLVYLVVKGVTVKSVSIGRHQSINTSLRDNASECLLDLLDVRKGFSGRSDSGRYVAKYLTGLERSFVEKAEKLIDLEPGVSTEGFVSAFSCQNDLVAPTIHFFGENV